MLRRRAAVSRFARVTEVAIVVLLACGSCTRVTHAGPASIGKESLAGRDVHLKTVDGRSYDVRVVEVGEDVLVTESREFSLQEIADIQFREVSFWRTVGAIAGGVAAAVGVWLIFLLSTWEG